MQELGPNQMAWLRELESDKYQQAENKLAVLMVGEVDYRYCCLGIGCEISDLQIEVENSWAPRAINEKVYAGESSLAPEPLQEWLGLRDEYGTATRDIDPEEYLTVLEERFGDSGICLTGFNDGGLTFRHIASIVRRCPEAFFTEPR